MASNVRDRSRAAQASGHDAWGMMHGAAAAAVGQQTACYAGKLDILAVGIVCAFLQVHPTQAITLVCIDLDIRIRSFVSLSVHANAAVAKASQKYRHKMRFHTSAVNKMHASSASALTCSLLQSHPACLSAR